MNTDGLTQAIHHYGQLSKCAIPLIDMLGGWNAEWGPVPEPLTKLRDDLLSNMQALSDQIAGAVTAEGEPNDPEAFLRMLATVLPKVMPNVQSVGFGELAPLSGHSPDSAIEHSAHTAVQRERAARGTAIESLSVNFDSGMMVTFYIDARKAKQ